jgi:hypothetical protein
MTYNDSVQIAATSRARRRAFARMGRVERASGRDTIEDVASGPGRTPRGRWVRRRDRGGNFPPCKTLKTHKTRKESRFCASPFMGPLNAPHTNEEVGIAAREAGGKRSRPSPRKWRRNGLKRLNQRPEMVWPRKRRTHQIWYTGARLTVRKKDKAGVKPSAPHKMRKEIPTWRGFPDVAELQQRSLSAVVVERLIFRASTKRNSRGQRPRLQRGGTERKIIRLATP